MNVFRRRKQDESNELMLEIPGLPQKTSYFGQHLHIQGDINGDDDVHIDGRVEGSIDVSSDVKINASAIINGDIRAHSITNSGVIKGDITALNKLNLENSAKVNGKIKTPAISMSEGAIFDGEMDMNTHRTKK